MSRSLALALVWVASVAATPLPLTPPVPDLTRLVPFAAAPLDKPAVAMPDVPLPPIPAELPPLPRAPLAMPAAERPVAPLPAPRTLPCIGSFLGVASESLECGRARFGKGDYDEAQKALESAVRTANERELAVEARYWLGETLARLGRAEQAAWTFRQAIGERPTLEHAVWALHASGWMALALGDPERARDAFTRLAAGAVPPPMATWGRHGLALALYALGQYAEAEKLWAELERRGIPSALARDVQFWQGETHGRLGDHARAETELKRFTSGGPHSLLETGSLRLGWWSLAGGHAAESVAAFRSYLALLRPVPTRAERPWAEAGLAMALAATSEWEPARDAARALIAAKSPLAGPVALTVVRKALEASKGQIAEAVVQEMLAGPITPSARAWLLLLRGDAHRLAGDRDEARTQYDLALKSQPAGDLVPHALLRLARVNFEMREFAQTVNDIGSFLHGSVPSALRAPAMFLQAEAAYRAGDFAAAEGAFRRIVLELPQHPEVPVARLSLAWVALRQGRLDEARRLFAGFARLHPDHAAAPDALVLAAELQLAGGDLDAARAELDRIIQAHATAPRMDFARLNRAIVALRTGRLTEAQPLLRDWIARAPFPPLLGRAHLALGAALLSAQAPAEAARHFAAAQRDGAGPVATLGLGAVALAEGKLDDATRLFTEARDTGTPDVTATAEYGLAAVGAQGSNLTSFKAPAQAALRAAPRAPSAPRLLYVLTGIAVEEKDWRAALDTAKRLVADFPGDRAADDALARVGAGAAAAASWPTAYDAFALLRARYPASPFVDSSRLTFATAQLETGRAEDARRALEPLAARTSDPDVWVLLAKAREGTGDRQGAIEAYGRAARDAKGAEFTRVALLGHARLLTSERRWDQARSVLERLLRSDDPALAIEAAVSIADTYRQEGDPLAAAEYFLTAAYLAPDAAAGRKALLAAGQSLAAAKHPDAAALAYRKLLAQPDLAAEVADAARQGLQALGRSAGTESR